MLGPCRVLSRPRHVRNPPAPRTGDHQASRSTFASGREGILENDRREAYTRTVASRLFVALVLFLAMSGSTAASVADDVRPFIYTFQVRVVQVHAVFTQGAATATTDWHLASLPKRKSLSWWGKKNYSNANGAVSAVLRLAGTATYAGLPGACNTTVALDSTRWRYPIFASLIVGNARNAVVTHPTLGVGVGRFPLATIYPARGGACENGALTWWDGSTGSLPLSAVRKSSFSFNAHDSKNIEDGATVEWTVKMSVRRVAYRLIDCSHSQLC